MAVTKRLRYEVLRRDGHACRYCGRSAPEVRLTVDHVVPTALGGSDDSSNLVAACSDCNSGKSASAPDAPIVADIASDALRWSAAIRQAADGLLADLASREANRRAFRTEWDGWTFGQKEMRIPLPDGWDRSVDNFLAAGLPMAVLIEDVRTAMGASKVAPEHTFRYMCGIAWKQIGELQDAARGLVSASPSTGTQPSAVEYVNTLWGLLPVNVTAENIRLWAAQYREECEDYAEDEDSRDVTAWPDELCAFTVALRDVTEEESAWQFATRLLRKVPVEARTKWLEEAEEMARKAGDETASERVLETALWMAFDHYRLLAGVQSDDEPPFAPNARD